MCSARSPARGSTRRDAAEDRRCGLRGGAEPLGAPHSPEVYPFERLGRPEKMPIRNQDLHGNVPDRSPVALVLVDVINDLEFISFFLFLVLFLS